MAECLFDSEGMAAGYAKSRPPVHQRILERIAAACGWRQRKGRGLDIGCGAGLATRALGDYVTHAIGVDPSTAMLRWAPATAPNGQFVAGAGEDLPFRDGSMDVITAAGSLNYADVQRSLPEAARVLGPQGILAIYD